MKNVVKDELKEKLKKKEVLDEKVKELSFKYCKNEKYILLLYKICLDLNVNDCNKTIEKFLVKV